LSIQYWFYEKIYEPFRNLFSCLFCICRKLKENEDSSEISEIDIDNETYKFEHFSEKEICIEHCLKKMDYILKKEFNLESMLRSGINERRI